MSTHARIIVAAAMVLCAAMVAGCDPAAWLLVKTIGPFVPENEVAAEHDLTGQSILVLVDTSDPVLGSEYPRLEWLIGESLGRNLKEHNAVGPIVPSRSLAAARRTERDFSRWTVAEVGRYFNVDLVLHVDVYDFRLRDAPGSNVFQGHAEAEVRLVSPEAGKQVWPVLASARIVMADTQPDVEPEEASELEAILIEGFADKIARHFYSYKMADFPLRPKVK